MQGDTTRRKHKRRINYIALASRLYTDLVRHGVAFDGKGRPILKDSALLAFVPDDVDLIPATKRKEARDKGRTILCFYETDSFLYRHLGALERRSEEFRAYYGIAGFDLSVCRNDETAEQRMMMLLNALVTAFFAVRGIRILRSLRAGDWGTLDLLAPHRAGGCYAMGLLGCRRTGSADAIPLLRARLAVVRPASLVLYGKPDGATTRELARFGVPFRAVDDWKTRSIAASASRRKAG